MKFRKSILLATTLCAALLGMGANGSYVVEVEGTNIITDALATGADFDFVTHDFGIDSGDAIQLTLANLSRATNLHGNLLLRSTTAQKLETPVNNEDYSYYDEDVAGAVDDHNGTMPEAAGELLPASVQDLPAIDTNAIFWILKPKEFSSFSQMTAACFGF